MLVFDNWYTIRTDRYIHLCKFNRLDDGDIVGSAWISNVSGTFKYYAEEYCLDLTHIKAIRPTAAFDVPYLFKSVVKISDNGIPTIF